MSRGPAGPSCNPLVLLGSGLQHARHEKARLLTGQFQYSCLISIDYLGRKVAHKGLDHRMADRFFGGVGQQVLLGDISDVFALRVLGEQMVKRLVLARAHLGRDRLPPFLGVVELWIDVEHHAAERIEAVLDHLAYFKLCIYNQRLRQYLNSAFFVGVTFGVTFSIFGDSTIKRLPQDGVGRHSNRALLIHINSRSHLAGPLTLWRVAARDSSAQLGAL